MRGLAGLVTERENATYISAHLPSSILSALKMVGLVPRGAVAIVCVCSRTARVALVTRSNPPDIDVWALPGGKIELGEPTITAAARELQEECGLGSSDVYFHRSPFTVTDVIRPEAGTPEAGTAFHYLLAQTFCKTRTSVDPSQLVAGDDAGAAQWFSLPEIADMQETDQLSYGVEGVIKRGLVLHEQGLLPVQE